MEQTPKTILRKDIFDPYFFPHVFHPSEKILVALSGGMDSVVLLHILKSLSETWRFNLTAAHVNHHLREKSSRDEKFVKLLCKTWDIHLLIFHGDPSTKKKGESVEMWARRIRYSHLEQCRKTKRCHWIATAHHGNDNVETILMNLNRGCGIDGIKGIPRQRDRIIRPLLSYSKSDIQSYIESKSLNYVEDETNVQLIHFRNRIRHKIVKPWEKQTPQLVNQFNEISVQAGKALNRLNIALKNLKLEVVTETKHGYKINGSLFEKLSPIIKTRFVKFLIGDPLPWRMAKWDKLKHYFSHGKTGDYFNVNKTWILLKDRSGWILSDTIVVPVFIAVTLGKSYLVNSELFSCKSVSAPTELHTNPRIEIVDGNLLKKGPVILRTWKKGDKFRPLGMTGNKKVSDYLIDAKIDRISKQQQLVLEAGGEIMWLCGQRISDTAKITSKTENFMELSFSKA